MDKATRRVALQPVKASSSASTGAQASPFALFVAGTRLQDDEIARERLERALRVWQASNAAVIVE